jgi:hypothetical protein
MQVKQRGRCFRAAAASLRAGWQQKIPEEYVLLDANQVHLCRQCDSVSSAPATGRAWHPAVEASMNWLVEYFAQQARTLNLALWVMQPARLGPDGPICPPLRCLPYPGIELVYSPAYEVRRGERVDVLPARYDAVLSQGGSSAVADKDTGRFFRQISIYAPSTLNPEPVIVINRNFSVTPVFAKDGTPGFVGLGVPAVDDDQPANQLKLPWLFCGYVTI